MPNWYDTTSSSASTTDQWITFTGGPTNVYPSVGITPSQPVTITVAPEKPKPETALEWLRRSVDEIRDLAWAA